MRDGGRDASEAFLPKRKVKKSDGERVARPEEAIKRQCGPGVQQL